MADKDKLLPEEFEIDDTQVKADFLSRVCQLEPQSISRHGKDGVLVRADKRGRYLLWPSLMGYIGFLQSSSKNPNKESTRKKAEADTRLREAQARRMERQNAESEKLLTEAQGVEMVMAQTVSLMYQKLEQIPHRIKRRYPSIENKHLEMIDSEIRSMQNLVSQMEFEEVDGKVREIYNPDELDQDSVID